MGLFGVAVESIKSFDAKQALTHFVTTGMVIASALILWKGLILVTGCESPVIVVLSGSMEPGVKRGDVLLLRMSEDPIRIGETVVFSLQGRKIPIVHRVIKLHERKDTGAVDLLTKGDANQGDDSPVYASGQNFLNRNHVLGRAIGFIPYAGWMTIIMNEMPIIKYVLLGKVALLMVA